MLNDQRVPFWDPPIIHVCFVRCGDWTRIAAMGIKPTISEVNSNNMLDLPSVPRRNDPKSPNGRTRIGKSFSNTKTRTRVNMCKPSYGCQYLLKSLIPVISWFINPTIVASAGPPGPTGLPWTCFARLGAAQQSPRWNGPLRRRWPTEPTRPGSLWSCSRNIYRKP